MHIKAAQAVIAIAESTELEIEAGEGTVLDGMGDKKFDPETGTHDKVVKNRKNSDGTQTEVHTERNRKTGKVDQAKIKQDGKKKPCKQKKRILMIVKKLSCTECKDANLLSDEKHYIVYAVMLGEQNKLLVEEDDAFSFPFFVHAKEFEITDDRLSAYWKYCAALDGQQAFSSRPAMLACEEMFDRLFYQKLVDGDENTKKLWELIKQRFDSEVGSDSSYIE